MHNVEHYAVAEEADVTANKLPYFLPNTEAKSWSSLGLSQRSAVPDGGFGGPHSFAAHGIEKQLLSVLCVAALTTGDGANKFKAAPCPPAEREA